MAKPAKMSRKKKALIIICPIVIVLFIAYWAACYIAVSLALVPSFMEKTSVFETVTDESMDQLVQTDDIVENSAMAKSETNAWLETADMEKISVVTDDGYKLVAAEFAPEEESHLWVLALHGYTGWKEEMYPIAYQYVKRGYHALVPDMRCSGESEGDFIGMGWTDRLDNLLWIDEILAEDPDAEIVLHGQSMGAACALMMAGEDLPEQVRAIVSDCAYTGAYEMFAKEMKDWFGLPSFPLLDSMNLVLQLRGGYNLKDASAIDAVARTDLPILFIHGEEDEMIPVEMAYELYDAAAGEKEILIVPGAGHAQSPDKDPELYYGTVFEFVGRFV
ncbi:MAG: alpha/beta hydrolase [Clostridiales bacterium]|nr:alpha/beta hydrolase [Clostridiales bacterium]